MNKKFTPMLIGKDEKEIENSIENWNNLISELNSLGETWRDIFNEVFTPKLLKEIVQSRQLVGYLKEHFIYADPERKKLIKRLNYKLENVIRDTQFPDFSYITNSAVYIRDQVIKKAGGNFNKYIDSIFIKNQYVLTKQLKKGIEDSYTYYTSSFVENVALLRVKKFCDLLNDMNDNGHDFNIHNIPRDFLGIVIPISTNKKYSELQFHSGNPAFYIQHIVPSPNMFKRESNSVFQNLKNLSEKELFELNKKLNSK